MYEEEGERERKIWSYEEEQRDKGKESEKDPKRKGELFLNNGLQWHTFGFLMSDRRGKNISGSRVRVTAKKRERERSMFGGKESKE